MNGKQMMNMKQRLELMIEESNGKKKHKKIIASRPLFLFKINYHHRR